MDNTNIGGGSDGHSRRYRSREGTGGGFVERAANKSISAEADVKRDAGPAVSNTYVAENMTVTNNYNF